MDLNPLTRETYSNYTYALLKKKKKKMVSFSMIITEFEKKKVEQTLNGQVKVGTYSNYRNLFSQKWIIIHDSKLIITELGRKECVEHDVYSVPKVATLEFIQIP